MPHIGGGNRMLLRFRGRRQAAAPVTRFAERAARPRGRTPRRKSAVMLCGARMCLRNAGDQSDRRLRNKALDLRKVGRQVVRAEPGQASPCAWPRTPVARWRRRRAASRDACVALVVHRFAMVARSSTEPVQDWLGCGTSPAEKDGCRGCRPIWPLRTRRGVVAEDAAAPTDRPASVQPLGQWSSALRLTPDLPRDIEHQAKLGRLALGSDLVAVDGR